MLTAEQINANKEEFISLICSIEREDFEPERLLKKLECSDFYIAPASTKYHNAFQGGLVDHSLNVFYNLMHLVKYKYPENCPIPEDSIKIVALLHDMSKMNIYKPSYRNKKIYCEDGDKRDDLGTFKWVSVPGYETRDAEERFVFGSHENTSEYMVRQFIPLTVEESVAIQHHMGGMAWDSAKDNIGEVWTQYPLSMLLHQADCLASYVDEQR